MPTFLSWIPHSIHVWYIYGTLTPGGIFTYIYQISPLKTIESTVGKYTIHAWYGFTFDKALTALFRSLGFPSRCWPGIWEDSEHGMNQVSCCATKDDDIASRQEWWNKGFKERLAWIPKQLVWGIWIEHITHRIHVWYIYLHLPEKQPNLGIDIPYMDPMG